MPALATTPACTAPVGFIEGNRRQNSSARVAIAAAGGTKLKRTRWRKSVVVLRLSEVPTARLYSGALPACLAGYLVYPAGPKRTGCCQNVSGCRRASAPVGCSQNRHRHRSSEAGGWQERDRRDESRKIAAQAPPVWPPSIRFPQICRVNRITTSIHSQRSPFFHQKSAYLTLTSVIEERPKLPRKAASSSTGAVEGQLS